VKEINQLIHLTSDIERLKSILKNGFFTSYAKESFAGKSILIPMISFTNLLYRDIGSNEVIDYGNYGLVFNRDITINKFDLNPVIYFKNESIVEKSIADNFETSVLPQVLDYVKDFYSNGNFKNITDHINFNPISNKVRNLINHFDENVNDEVVNDLKIIFGELFTNSLNQLLLAKPYKVFNKSGEIKIAYNEREWRKSFFNLNFIFEFKPNGSRNEKYHEWINKPKPHFVKDHVLKISISDIKSIIVMEEFEIEVIKKFIHDEVFSEKIDVEINTLSYFKETEIHN